MKKDEYDEVALVYNITIINIIFFVIPWRRAAVIGLNICEHKHIFPGVAETPLSFLVSITWDANLHHCSNTL